MEENFFNMDMKLNQSIIRNETKNVFGSFHLIKSVISQKQIHRKQINLFDLIDINIFNSQTSVGLIL
jgi:hypothetical protein